MLFKQNSLIGRIFNDFIYKSPTACINNLINDGADLKDGMIDQKVVKSGYFPHEQFFDLDFPITNHLEAHVTYFVGYQKNQKLCTTLIVQLNIVMTQEFDLFIKTIKENNLKIAIDNPKRISAETSNFSDFQVFKKLELEAWEKDSNFGFAVHLSM